jgi:hypothetical protein
MYYLKAASYFLIILLLTATMKSSAQYYYKDLVSNQQVLSERRMLKEQKIRNILVHSFEANGEASPGFFCEKQISKDYRRIETYTKSNITGKSLLTTYYNDLDQLVQTTDSSEISLSTTRYQYDEMGTCRSSYPTLIPMMMILPLPWWKNAGIFMMRRASPSKC